MMKTENKPQVEGRISTTRPKSHVTKILIAGSGAVGKTTLLQVLKNNELLGSPNISQEYHRTPFLNLETISVERIGGTGSKGIFLMVDIAGQLDLPIHALRDFPKVSLGSVELVMLIFSADNLQSLLDLKDWISLVKVQHKGAQQLSFVLIMNKCDLDRSMDTGLVQQLMASEPQIESYFEISCRDGQGVKKLQSWLASIIESK